MNHTFKLFFLLGEEKQLPHPPHNGFLTLGDGDSFLVLGDGVSKIIVPVEIS